MYRFENLPVGIYSVTFALSGFITVKHEGIRVEVGRSVELDQILKVGAVAETLTVVGESPVVDTVHAGTSTNFNTQLLDNSPTSRNQFFDALAYAPAVKSASQSIGASSQFVIFGSQSSQNAFQYDGLDVSAPSFGGPYDWPNYDMMSELQVKSVGASAEQAGFQGGVVNLVLKSGSNTFKGSASYYGLVPGCTATTHRLPVPANVAHNNDLNFTFGGPIKKDRVWFQFINENIRRLQTPVGVPAELAQPVEIWRPYIKVNARLSNADDISFSYNDCRDWWSYGASLTTRPEAGGVEIGHDPVIIARWTHAFGSSTMLEVAGGGVYVRKTNTAVSGDLDTPGHVDLGDRNHERQLGVREHERPAEQDQRQRQAVAHGDRLHQGHARVQVRRPDGALEHGDCARLVRKRDEVLRPRRQAVLHRGAGAVRAGRPHPDRRRIRAGRLDGERAASPSTWAFATTTPAATFRTPSN